MRLSRATADSSRNRIAPLIQHRGGDQDVSLPWQAHTAMGNTNRQRARTDIRAVYLVTVTE